jgi:hypothetical protein
MRSIPVAQVGAVQRWFAVSSAKSFGQVVGTPTHAFEAHAWPGQQQ